MLGTPRFVRGLSIIRGEPVPVIDLRLLLDNDESNAAGDRFVTIKTGERRAALAVDTVVGLRDLDPTLTQELPPLLQNIDADLIEAIGRSDEQLLLVLRATRLVPEEVWASLAATTQAR
jgi:purine-binding chemotaxis protein CheW